jgi:hypothetical protein
MSARDSRGYLISVGDRLTRISAGTSDALQVGASYVVNGITPDRGWVTLEGVDGEFSPALFERVVEREVRSMDLSKFNAKVEDWASNSHYVAITEKPTNGSENGTPVFSFFSIGERPDPTDPVQLTNLAKQDRIRVISALVDNWYKILEKLGLPSDVEIENLRRLLNAMSREYSNSATTEQHTALGRYVDLTS